MNSKLLQGEKMNLKSKFGFSIWALRSTYHLCGFSRNNCSIRPNRGEIYISIKNTDNRKEKRRRFDEISTNSSKIIKIKRENVKNYIKQELDIYLNLYSIASNLMQCKKEAFLTLSRISGKFFQHLLLAFIVIFLRTRKYLWKIQKQFPLKKTLKSCHLLF